VDLAQVLAAAPGGDSRPPAGPPDGERRRDPPKGPDLDAAPKPTAAVGAGPVSSTAPGPSPAAAPEDRIPATLDAVRAAWTDIVAELRGRSRFLGEALAAGTPAAFDPPWLTVTLGEPNALFAERLQANARAVEEVLQRLTGQPARLRVTEVGASDPALQARPRKLTEASLKADRLRAFRAKDPTLDTAADALDLEIVD
jgi:hypothetical protein